MEGAEWLQHNQINFESFRVRVRPSHPFQSTGILEFITILQREPVKNQDGNLKFIGSKDKRVMDFL
ncbi:588_t:CDS:2 [Funneliformis caledonium]|uniref:588_t:CDS:1 n=1 Tax=Funneliformis caledonium TaxID=1117310 RepID=A0A9N8VZ91_9GLOM|nr:588_t:CDS:2 [Funneliformis caledonium]